MNRGTEIDEICTILNDIFQEYYIGVKITPDNVVAFFKQAKDEIIFQSTHPRKVEKAFRQGNSVIDLCSLIREFQELPGYTGQGRARDYIRENK